MQEFNYDQAEHLEMMYPEMYIDPDFYGEDDE